MAALVAVTDDESSMKEIKKFLRAGTVKLSASQMHLIMRTCVHPTQAKIRNLDKPSARQHIAVLADLMKRGDWLPRRQIDFALLDGWLWLMNGNHRGEAQVLSGQTIEWTIEITPVVSEVQLHRLFYKFDTNTRGRSDRQILAAVGFSGKADLPHEIRKSLYSAALTLLHDFDLQKRKTDPIHSRNIDRRLQMAQAWIREAVIFAECIDPAEPKLKKKLRASGVMAIALATLRYQRERAIEFWSSVAANDGLRKLDPRHTLVTDLLTRNYRGGTAKQIVVVPALAWNAWFAGETRKSLRVTDNSKVVILGTPWGGK